MLTVPISSHVYVTSQLLVPSLALCCLCGPPQSLLAVMGTLSVESSETHLQQFRWKETVLVLRTGNFKAQLGSEAPKVFRALSPSPGFPASVGLIRRPSPRVWKMAAAAPVCFLSAHHLQPLSAYAHFPGLMEGLCLALA